MRPSVAQLLQHERLELVFKVSETEKMSVLALSFFLLPNDPSNRLATVKAHKANMVAKERELSTREATFAEKEAHLQALLSQKDTEIAALQAHAHAAVVQAVAKREEELRVLVMKHEAEVVDAMTRREEELMDAVKKRETELVEEWKAREEQIQREAWVTVDERMQWVVAQEEEMEVERQRLKDAKVELETKLKALDEVPKGLCY